MSFWSIIVPEATTNWTLNPSAETTSNFAAHNGSTVTRSTIQSRHGVYAYFVNAAGTNQGINLTLATLANAIHNVTFYVRGTITGTLQVSLNAGANYNAATRVNGDLTVGWARYNIEISAAQSNGSTACIIRNTANEDYYIDCVQVEAKSGYYTTYCDGDMPGCRWDGLRHGGKSSRNVQYRRGGRIRDLADFGIYVKRSEFSEIGMPPLSHNLFVTATGKGALYQNAKIEARTIQLVLEIEGSTWYDLHAKRQDLLNIIESSQYRGNQPFRLIYTGASTTRFLYIDCRYEGGLNFSNDTGFTEEPPLRVIAEDPFWYEDDRDVAALTTEGSFTPARIHAKINGTWGSLGSGFNNTVRAIAVDERNGRIFFGGDFTTANGVTVNGCCYWNPTTQNFVALGAGTVGVSGGNVYTIAIAPNGDVWFGGTFTGFNGGATVTHGLVRWDGSIFNAYALAAGSIFYALEFDNNGNLYAGGNFINWNAIANADYIAKLDITGTWSALGTGMNGNVRALKWVDSTHLYVAGEYTTGNGVTLNRAGYWNGTTFVAMGSGADAAMYAICAYPNGDVVYGGTCTTLNGASMPRIGLWNGAWTALGSGLSGTGVNALAIDSVGRLLVGGSFGVSDLAVTLTDNFAVWSGSRWWPADCIGNMTVNAIAVAENGDIYYGHTKTTTTTPAGITTVTSRATVAVNPIIYVEGSDPGSTVSTDLQSIENQSSAQWVYFDYTLAQGPHIITIDFSGQETIVISDWYGPIANNPLSGSDEFQILPGANVISTWIEDLGDFCIMALPIAHISADGVA